MKPQLWGSFLRARFKARNHLIRRYLVTAKEAGPMRPKVSLSSDKESDKNRGQAFGAITKHCGHPDTHMTTSDESKKGSICFLQ
jgi:hypothetical protein